MYQYPLVLNYHGINTTATQQQNYSQMNTVADLNNFIVVYPQAVNNSWNLNGNAGSPNDSLFTTILMDSLIARYSINTSRIYICGMSMGGFMCYNLLCALENRIAAAAIVSGNMSDATKSNCNLSRSIPILHIHGTDDQLVPYNGSFGISDVESTINWWVLNNACSTIPIITSIPDIISSDSCYAERFYYAPTTADSAEVEFIKISNGGHTWPGATVVPLLGNTCQDFNASTIIWDFFSQHDFTVNMPENSPQQLKIYPNPANSILTITLNDTEDAFIINITGKIFPIIREKNKVDISGIPDGIYIIHTSNGRTAKVIIYHPD